MSHGFPDVPLEATMMGLRVEDARRQAEVVQALCQAGVVRQRWLTWRTCHLLCQLGRKLVEVGERLERYDMSQTIPLAGLQDV